MTTKIIVALAALGMLAGCATTDFDEFYGQSVASLIVAQTANPETWPRQARLAAHRRRSFTDAERRPAG